jgi:HEAT repeat protein
MNNNEKTRDNELRKKLYELHHLDEVIKEIAALGNRAVTPLGEYLKEPPEVVPHSRVAAVRALGLIGTELALHQLKNSLFIHEFNEISAECAQSEYVVKNAIVDEMMRLSPKSASCDFLEAFKRYRLPAVIQAIVIYRILEAIPLLVHVLEDDVLALRAAEALQQLGEVCVDALLHTLAITHPSKEQESRVSLQRRILACSVLGKLEAKNAVPTLNQMIKELEPNLAGVAAATLALLHAPLSLKDMRLVLNATLSKEYWVQAYCREAAFCLGNHGVHAALEAIHLQSFSDFYGHLNNLSPTDKTWLITYILEHASTSDCFDLLIHECPQELLIWGIERVQSERAMPALLYLLHHGNPEIRSAVTYVFRNIPNKNTAKILIHLLGDSQHKIVKEAQASLSHFSKDSLKDVMQEALSTITPFWKRWFVTMKIRRLMHKNK